MLNSGRSALERDGQSAGLNRILFDLDPGPQVAWSQVITAAKLVRTMLSALDLDSWVKTTGGRGLHVVMPVKPDRDWMECLAFARAIAELLVTQDMALYTTNFRKRGRERQILVDYLRNNRTNTSISAFSLRARTNAPASMPIAWEDLTSAKRPERFTLKTASALPRLIHGEATGPADSALPTTR